MNLTLGITVNLITFLSGLIIGNRLAIGRNKRKEFNEISLQLFTDQ